MSTASETKPRKPPKPDTPPPPPDTTPEQSFWAQLKFLKPYWVSEEKKKARWQLGAILVLTVAEIAITAGVSLGFRAALNALASRQAMEFAIKGGLTLAGLGATTLSSNGRDYLTLTLGQNWRQWLSNKYSESWLGGKAYLRFQHNKNWTQNPDQRIAETIPNVTGTTLNLALGLFRSVIGVATFSVMLWHISPIMVGAALVCSAGAHGLTHWAGGSMRKVWRAIMDTEARFRHALGRVRDNAKPIALAGLEPVENETLKTEFKNLDDKRRDFYKFNWRTGLVGTLNANTATIVPIALSAPGFFAGVGTLGGLELTRQVYGQFYNAISWFPQGYSQIASWQANVNQLMEFDKDLKENRLDIDSKSGGPELKPGGPKLSPDASIKSQFAAALQDNKPPAAPAALKQNPAAPAPKPNAAGPKP
jgi:putative ATP-binding cassette transporter